MYKYRRIIVSVIAGLLAFLLIAGVLFSAFAESSSEIQDKINALKDQEASINAEQEAVNQKISENKNSTMNLVEKKNLIDQQIKLTRDSIDNKNNQIQEFNLLIAEKQNELDEALSKKDSLNQRYQARIRSMEENGKLTYWSILFKASSFADMLDRVDMINEIAMADSRMLEKIQKTARKVEKARGELAQQKVELEEAKAQLAEEEKQLEKKRAEADEVFAELNQDRQALLAAEEEYESQKEALLRQIAVQEANYQEAVEEEERARREAEEAAARARAEAAAREAAARAAAATGNSGSNSGSGSSSGANTGSASSAGFIWPSDCHYISCHFGPRVHPITGQYSNHSGMDIGASYGSPIYACASGTVTTATYNYIYGYHVVINHGNGFSTLYGHMTQYIVSEGDYVTQGQVIGYVGNTGWSTAPHLHLTMYLNGELVNPLTYLP